jgi:hypothetical protein
VVRRSARYEETVTFYRDAIGLPVLETFHDSYGLDGTMSRQDPDHRAGTSGVMPLGMPAHAAFSLLARS